MEGETATTTTEATQTQQVETAAPVETGIQDEGQVEAPAQDQPEQAETHAEPADQGGAGDAYLSDLLKQVDAIGPVVQPEQFQQFQPQNQHRQFQPPPAPQINPETLLKLAPSLADDEAKAVADELNKHFATLHAPLADVVQFAAQIREQQAMAARQGIDALHAKFIAAGVKALGEPNKLNRNLTDQIERLATLKRDMYYRASGRMLSDEQALAATIRELGLYTTPTKADAVKQVQQQVIKRSAQRSVAPGGRSPATASGAGYRSEAEQIWTR